MTLGKRIYDLRTAKNLSQGDLAEALGVSRQSVSKWETDTSVPDLDKLVKLCDLFGVSMDELVRGETPKAAEPTQPPIIIQEVKSATPGRVIVGAILLAIGILTSILLILFADVLFVLLLGLPLIVCGIICLAVRWHPGLWCGWALWIYAGLSLTRLTGGVLSVRNVSFTVHSMVSLGIILWGAIMAAVTAAIVVKTIRKRRNKHETTL